ncbi:RNase III domain-containing protein [[Candida] zeylanoides]
MGHGLIQVSPYRSAIRSICQLHAKHPSVEPYQVAVATTALEHPAPLDVLLNSAWIRNHLYMIGSDLLRLRFYQKLSHLIEFGGGPLIKSIVFDLSAFIRRELAPARPHTSSNTSAEELRELLFTGTDMAALKASVNISDFRWLYITVGYMLLSNSTGTTEEVSDRIIEAYIRSRNAPYLRTTVSEKRGDVAKIIVLAREFYLEVPINADKIYQPKERYITLYDTKGYRVKLPPLPRLYNKENLVKSLIHKELYRAWLSPNHELASRLQQSGIDLAGAATRDTLKHDLSFLDGLGDLYLARESSKFLYKFGGAPAAQANDRFGTRTYNRLRKVLGTNTLLSKLAVAYELHEGLGDDAVATLLHESYVPNIGSWDDPNCDNDTRRYEQEFIADYFEQYVGALFLESPDKAHAWVSKIYENVLQVIIDVHRVTVRDRKKFAHSYDYRAWSSDVIGRNIWH